MQNFKDKASEREGLKRREEKNTIGEERERLEIKTKELS